MTDKWRCHWIWGLIVIFCAVRAAAAAAPSPAAAEILKASGVEGGIVVCVGATTPDVPLALRVDDRYLVQALSADPDDVRAIRVAARAKDWPVPCRRRCSLAAGCRMSIT